MKLFVRVLVPAALLALAGCTSLRFLEEDERLYTGAEVALESPESKRSRRGTESELEEVVRPSPNSTFLGFMRPRLWLHYRLEAPEQQGLRARLYERFAESPVLFDEVSPEENAARLRAWLHNHGYFDAEVEYDVREQRRRAGLIYEVHAGVPYRIGSISRPRGQGELVTAIRAASRGTLLRAGDSYELATLREERVRIDSALKDDGFYAFSPDYLLFNARRDHPARTVDLELIVKPESPDRARRRHHIAAVTVYGDHQFGSREPPGQSNSIEIGPRFRYVVGGQRLRPDVVTGAILLRPGDRYSRSRHLETISRLMSLGVFQFASIRYEYVDEGEALHAFIYLTPEREKLVSGEVQMATRSDDFAGPGVELGYRDRNTFGGAEQLRVDLRSAFETELGGGAATVDSWDAGADVSLAIPGIMASPPRRMDWEGPVMPQTELSAGVSSMTRVDLYRLDQVRGSVGYRWSPRETVQHHLRPLEIAYVRPGEFSSEFSELLDRNPALRRGFEEQFVLGGSYEYLYNDRREPRRRNNTVVNVDVDLAGNLISAGYAAVDGKYPDADDPREVLGRLYSQFARVDGDVRYFIPVTGDSTLAARVLAGAGYAFGNSSVLPRPLQFSVGGTNGIRAFHRRTIGPGALTPESDGGPSIERTGDIRLEAALEYRFPVAGMLKGAIFADAGNIWTFDREGVEEAGVFEAERALEQLALGGGFGLRLDPNLVVLRLDVATPLRKPWLPTGERWVTGDIDPTDRSWRRENIVFNLAIGYPY